MRSKKKQENKLLRLYLPSTNTIPEITDIVCAMGKAIGYAAGIKQKEGNENRSKKTQGGNRRECKLKVKMERAETRCSQTRKRTPSSKAAKEIYKKRETDHEITWNENEQ